MAWVYLDDHWDENPKLLAVFHADPQALVLFFAGITYCRRTASGGLIPVAKVRGLLGWRPRSQKVLETDYGAGNRPGALWHPVRGGAIDVHDYDQWNHHAEERSASARNAAQVRWKRAREEAAHANES
jgi:hypothetical protein